MRRNEQRLAALRESSSDIVPLKLRRTRPTAPTTVVSLCDWEDEEVRSNQRRSADLRFVIEAMFVIRSETNLRKIFSDRDAVHYNI